LVSLAVSFAATISQPLNINKMGFVTTLSQLVNVPEGLVGHAVVVLITIAVSSSFLLWRQLDLEVHDASEPPIAYPSVPIIGHMLGMRKHQIRYLEILRYKYLSSAFFLNVLTCKGKKLRVQHTP
jgi:hypothetical protein